MRILITILLVLNVLAIPASSQSTNTPEYIITDVSVISMLNEKIADHQYVTVKNGLITSISDQSGFKGPRNAVIINGTGKFLMPGLAEMHAHVPPVNDLQPMKELMVLFAANGITTIRGMLGHPKHLELREKLASGEIPGPHFYTTGPSLNGNSVPSPEEGANMVRRQKASGYDFLKLHPGLSRAKFDSIAAAAKAVAIPFAGHVSWDVGVWRAIEAGYSSIDHLDGFVEALVPGIEKMTEEQAGLFGMFLIDKVEESRIPRLVAALKEKNVSVVPTQSLAERWFHPDFKAEEFRNDPEASYMNAGTVSQWIASKNSLINNPSYNADKVKKFIALRRRLIKACENAGVQLLLGCDAPQVFNVPGFSTHHELEYLVASGLTPYQALRTGTVNVARYLNLKDSGVIRVGAVSDLLLLEGNPLTDITQTRKIAGVMIGKTWWPKQYIEGELQKLSNR
jgi:imidazolonepropionase-like amidohydrolase